MMKPVVRPPGIVGCRMDCMVLARDVSYISNPTHPSAAHSPTGLPYHTTTMKSIVSVKRSKLPPEKKYVHIVSTEYFSWTSFHKFDATLPLSEFILFLCFLSKFACIAGSDFMRLVSHRINHVIIFPHVSGNCTVHSVPSSSSC